MLQIVLARTIVLKRIDSIEMTQVLGWRYKRDHGVFTTNTPFFSPANPPL